MQTTSIQAARIQAAERTEQPFAFLGLFVTAVVPAMFWVAVYAGLANIFGYPTDVSILVLAGSGIAAFLGLIFAVLTSEPR